jgi:hypothetical protein
MRIDDWRGLHSCSESGACKQTQGQAGRVAGVIDGAPIMQTVGSLSISSSSASLRASHIII